MKTWIKKILDWLALILIKMNIVIKKRGSSNLIINSKSLDKVMINHFTKFSSLDHINYKSIETALNLFNKFSTKNRMSIIETGSAAYGTTSTILFDSYLNFEEKFNLKKCSLISCDIRITPMIVLNNKLSKLSECVCDDSVHFLDNLSKNSKEFYDNSDLLIYLDSFDLDYSDPLPSGYHGLKELIAIEPLLKKGTLLLIDDTPKSIDFCQESQKVNAKNSYNKYGLMPGKGMFIKKVLEERRDVELIFHEYQLLYKFN